MRRPVSLIAGILERFGNAASVELVPQSIDKDAGGEGIFLCHEPVREVEAGGIGVVELPKNFRNGGKRLRAGFVHEVSSLEGEGFLGFGFLADESRDGTLAMKVDLAIEFGELGCKLRLLSFAKRVVDELAVDLASVGGFLFEGSEQKRVEVIAVVAIKGPFPEVAVGGCGVFVFEELVGGGAVTGVSPSDFSSCLHPSHDLRDVGGFEEFGFGDLEADELSCFREGAHVGHFLRVEPWL